MGSVRRSFPMLVALAVLPVTASALSLPDRTESHPLFLGAGAAFQDANRTAVDDTGDTSVLSGALLSVSVAGRFSVRGHWGISPVLTYTPFGLSGADTGEKTTILTFDTRLFREFGAFDLHAGPGILFDTISGSGGTATLNNGSSTAVFGLPSGSSTSRFFYIEAGLGVHRSRFRLDLDFLVTDTFSARRAVYPSLTASVGLF